MPVRVVRMCLLVKNETLFSHTTEQELSKLQSKKLKSKKKNHGIKKYRKIIKKEKIKLT